MKYTPMKTQWTNYKCLHYYTVRESIKKTDSSMLYSKNIIYLKILSLGKMKILLKL